MLMATLFLFGLRSITGAGGEDDVEKDAVAAAHELKSAACPGGS